MSEWLAVAIIGKLFLIGCFGLATILAAGALAWIETRLERRRQDKMRAD